LRHGRAVQIKMSSATTGTGSMISLLFVSLTANCLNFQTRVAAAAKVLSPKQVADSQHPRVSGTQFLARASVTSWQSSARYPGAWPDMYLCLLRAYFSLYFSVLWLLLRTKN